MAPSAVSYTHEEPAPSNGTANAKMAALPHNTAVPVGNGTKPEVIEEMAGKWSDFKFKPIRESQVSRTYPHYIRETTWPTSNELNRRHDPSLLQ